MKTALKINRTVKTKHLYTLFESQVVSNLEKIFSVYGNTLMSVSDLHMLLERVSAETGLPIFFCIIDCCFLT